MIVFYRVLTNHTLNIIFGTILDYVCKIKADKKTTTGATDFLFFIIFYRQQQSIPFFFKKPEQFYWEQVSSSRALHYDGSIA